MKAIFFLALFTGLLAISSARRVKFENCGPSKIEYVDMEPCDEEPCKFHHGEIAHIEGRGVSASDANKATIKAVVDLDDIPVEVPDIDPDACKIVECPIVKGKTYSIKYDFEIQDFFPELLTNLTVTVTGDTEDVILLCIKGVVGVLGDD